MAYYDVPSADYGTYSSWLIPDPSSPITHGWGSSIVLALTRLVKSGWATVAVAGINGTAVMSFNRQNHFQKIPFIKIYRMKDGTYNDYRCTGDLNNYHPSWGAALQGQIEAPTVIGFYDNSDVDTFFLTWGIENGQPPNQQSHTIIVLANGR